MKVVLISTYDLGRQPLGLASPAAWLRAAGHEVTCCDLAIGALPTLQVREAHLIAIHLPMHTATRLAAQAIRRVRHLNPTAQLCAYGLYAPLNEQFLRSLGVRTVLGGEYEADLTALASGSDVPEARVSLELLSFVAPDRRELPVLSRYPKLVRDNVRLLVGYTEASRGCKHRCRHCPVVPVYRGQFRIIPADIVLADVRAQIAAGAQHIAFGDPDFFNGPKHAERILRRFHSEFPETTYDVTVKIEHIIRHRDLLAVLRDTGCLLVTSAVESVDDSVLEKLGKGHTRDDFLLACDLLLQHQLTLSPTFIPFTPWTTLAGYRELLRAIVDADLVANVNPVQLGLRLLITSGSRLLELPDIREVIREFEHAALCYRWDHADSSVDALATTVMRTVQAAQRSKRTRVDMFQEIWRLANPGVDAPVIGARATIPYLEEPWFC